MLRQPEHGVPEALPRPISPRDGALDIRIWASRLTGLPRLLVTASRKQGMAVQRNRFKRRVRMALLGLLRERPDSLPSGLSLWVRPGRSQPKGCPISFSEIEGQLRLAFRRWADR